MMTARARCDDDSSLDCNELSTVDQREAYDILTSLGKKYYQSIGMGKSLDIAKLRQLQGANDERKDRTLPKKEKEEKEEILQRSRIPRKDSILHYPFKDKGGVQELLKENLRGNISLFHTMAQPARKKVAIQVYHDNVMIGMAKMRYKEVPPALESLGLTVPNEILDIVYDQYASTANNELYHSSTENNMRLNISMEEWVNLVEECLRQELKDKEKKRIQNALELQIKLKDYNDRNIRNSYRLHNNDYDNDEIHNNNNYYDDEEKYREHSNFQNKSFKGLRNKNMKMKMKKRSLSMSAIRGTENSVRRSVSTTTTPQYVHSEETVDQHSVCDRRARPIFVPRDGVLGVRDGDREGGRLMGGTSTRTSRRTVEQDEERGREREREVGRAEHQRPQSASNVYRIRSTAAGATVRSTGSNRKPSDPGLFFGTGTGGGGFIRSFYSGGMKNRVGHYNHRLQHTQQQHDKKHNQRQRSKAKNLNNGFYNDVEWKVLSPLNRHSRTLQNKNSTLDENMEESEMQLNDFENNLSPASSKRKTASELAKIRYDKATYFRDKMYTEKAATEILRSAKIDEILSNFSRIVDKPKSSDNIESDENFSLNSNEMSQSKNSTKSITTKIDSNPCEKKKNGRRKSKRNLELSSGSAALHIAEEFLSGNVGKFMMMEKTKPVCVPTQTTSFSTSFSHTSSFSSSSPSPSSPSFVSSSSTPISHRNATATIERTRQNNDKNERENRTLNEEEDGNVGDEREGEGEVDEDMVENENNKTKKRNKKSEKGIEKEKEFNLKQLQREEERRLYYQGWTEYNGGCVVDFGLSKFQNKKTQKTNNILKKHTISKNEGESEDGSESEDLKQFIADEKIVLDDNSENDENLVYEVLRSERELEWEKLKEKEEERKEHTRREVEIEMKRINDLKFIEEKEIQERNEMRKKIQEERERERKMEREIEKETERSEAEKRRREMEREREEDKRRGEERDREQEEEREREREYELNFEREEGVKRTKALIKERERIREEVRERMQERERERKNEAERDVIEENKRENEREKEWKLWREKEKEKRKQREIERENEWRRLMSIESEVTIEKDKEKKDEMEKEMREWRNDREILRKRKDDEKDDMIRKEREEIREIERKERLEWARVKEREKKRIEEIKKQKIKEMESLKELEFIRCKEHSLDMERARIREEEINKRKKSIEEREKYLRLKHEDDMKINNMVNKSKNENLKINITDKKSDSYISEIRKSVTEIGETDLADNKSVVVRVATMTDNRIDTEFEKREEDCVNVVLKEKKDGLKVQFENIDYDHNHDINGIGKNGSDGVVRRGSEENDDYLYGNNNSNLGVEREVEKEGEKGVERKKRLNKDIKFIELDDVEWAAEIKRIRNSMICNSVKVIERERSKERNSRYNKDRERGRGGGDESEGKDVGKGDEKVRRDREGEMEREREGEREGERGRDREREGEREMRKQEKAIERERQKVWLKEREILRERNSENAVKSRRPIHDSESENDNDDDNDEIDDDKVTIKLSSEKSEDVVPNVLEEEVKEAKKEYNGVENEFGNEDEKEVEKEVEKEDEKKVSQSESFKRLETIATSPTQLNTSLQSLRDSVSISLQNPQPPTFSSSSNSSSSTTPKNQSITTRKSFKNYEIENENKNDIENIDENVFIIGEEMRKTFSTPIPFMSPIPPHHDVSLFATSFSTSSSTPRVYQNTPTSISNFSYPSSFSTSSSFPPPLPTTSSSSSSTSYPPPTLPSSTSTVPQFSNSKKEKEGKEFEKLLESFEKREKSNLDLKTSSTVGIKYGSKDAVEKEVEIGDALTAFEEELDSLFRDDFYPASPRYSSVPPGDLSMTPGNADIGSPVVPLSFIASASPSRSKSLLLRVDSLVDYMIARSASP